MVTSSGNNGIQNTGSSLPWSRVPDELVCNILSFTPESALSVRVVSRELHRISGTFLELNKKRIARRCSTAGSSLSQFINRSLTRFTIPAGPSPHCSDIQFHLSIAREIRFLGITDCPDTVLSSREIDRYNAKIQDDNLQRSWARIQPLALMATPAPREIPAVPSSAQEIRIWLQRNTHLLGTITHLSLEELELTSLPAEINHFTNLLRLSLYNNQLRELPFGAFRGLNQLQELSLYGNQLGILQPGALDGLDQLQRLYLHSNRLTTLPAGLFKNVGQLRLIFLQNNLLEALPLGAFEGLDQLRQLYLDNNQLRALPPGIFDGLDQLRTLQLQHNRLEALPPEAFDGLTNLQLLALYNNQLDRLSPTVFDALDQLQSLSIYHNPRLLIPYHDLPVFQDNISFLEMMHAFFTYRCNSPFAQFYQLAAGDAPTETVKASFHTLGDTLKNAIFEGVYIEAGRPNTADCKWGEHHVFDSTGVFNGALKRVVKEKFENLTNNQANNVYDRVYTLASSEREAQGVHLDDPQCDTDPTHDNILRLIDALHELQIWES